MPFTFYLDLFTIAASATTVGLIFYQGIQQKKYHREQQHINVVQHARISNLERQVLRGPDAEDVSHHVH